MRGTLIIRPMNGDLTRNTDLFQKMDPYVKVFLGAQHRQTRVARKEGKHPVWRDELTLQYDSHDDLLNFEVWDEDTHKKDDFVGAGSIAVATVQQKGNKIQEWVKLSYKGRYAGEILVDITFIPDNGINQQNQNMMIMSTNNMQVTPNQMMQSNYQNVYPMMSASQGMIPQQQIPLRPQYQQQNSFQQQPTFVSQNSYVSQGSMPQQVLMQPEFTQQMQMQGQVQPQYQQQNSFQQQQQQQQPIYVKQNSYAHHYPQEQVQMQQVIPQQVQIQQEIPYQARVEEIPIQQNYPQEYLLQKSYSYAPPIERASTINRTQLRARTQINQGGQPSQGNPNQFDSFILRGA